MFALHEWFNRLLWLHPLRKRLLTIDCFYLIIGIFKMCTKHLNKLSVKEITKIIFVSKKKDLFNFNFLVRFLDNYYLVRCFIWKFLFLTFCNFLFTPKLYSSNYKLDMILNRISAKFESVMNRRKEGAPSFLQFSKVSLKAPSLSRPQLSSDGGRLFLEAIA